VAKPEPLYEACKACRGTRLAPPDHLLHESLPDHSPKVLRPRRPRAGRGPCPACSGIGYLAIELTRDFVADLAAEHEAALEVLREFVALFYAHDEGDVGYISDGDMLTLCLRSEAILARDHQPADRK
jgi:hypothetical protein